MLPVAFVSHSIPGRLRLRIPEKRGDAGFFSELARILQECEGVIHVVANPATAGALVLHSTEPERLECYARERNLFALGVPRAADETLIGSFAGCTRSVDQWLRDSTSGRVDLASLGFASLLGLTAYQIREGRFLAPGATLLWYALSLLFFYFPPGSRTPAAPGHEELS